MSERVQQSNVPKPSSQRIQPNSTPVQTAITSPGSSNMHESTIQRVNHGAMPLNGEQLNHRHQTIGAQATLQLLRDRQANYKPTPVMSDRL
ncbi:MAG: hypothetical protein AAF639_00340 [Chloroflexota bacterium]